MAPGSGQWTEFGVVDAVLRRGDFMRIGTDTSKGWSTLTGIFVVVYTATAQIVTVKIDNLYLRGGRPLDTSEVGTTPYDYRVTHYDTRTGAESNPSPIQATTAFLDSLRRAITITPAAAYSDANVRQRIYRRGANLPDDWYYVGVNASDGAAYTDLLSDTTIGEQGTLEIDHDQPLNTVDDTGATQTAKAGTSIFGPIQNLLFAIGDKYRPGDAYWCIPNQPDHWPAANHVEVCPPSEQLVNGCVWGGQAWVFSTEWLYQLIPNLSEVADVTPLRSGCHKGLIGARAFSTGPFGIAFVGVDGIYITTGQAPVNITDDDVRGLFHGETRNGYLPVDLTKGSAIRLICHDNELRFLYTDSGSAQKELVFNLLTRRWRANSYGVTITTLYSEESGGASTLILGGTNAAYTNAGASDAGAAIACVVRTGAMDQGAPRQDKSYGDVVIDADADGETVTVAPYTNNEATALATQTLVTMGGRRRSILDLFGTVPTEARNLALDLSWSSFTGRPRLWFGGVSVIPRPDLTVKRPTDWDDLGSSNEKYFMGVTIDCDTGGVAKTVLVEYTLDNGAVVVASTLTINSPSRRLMTFSWSAVKADMVRLRADDTVEWKFYKADWDFTVDPKRTTYWDTGFENLGDTYYTGIDLEVDTFALPKSIIVSIDGIDLPTQTIAATNGRKFIHVTLPEYGGNRRAHIYRLRSGDGNPGLLYSHKWIVDAEPGEQTNWNQNYTPLDGLSNKYIKGVVLDVDTFGATKTVQVEGDGSTLATLTVVSSGRGIVNFGFTATQARLLRLMPTDSSASRLYAVKWIYDTEPFALGAWDSNWENKGDTYYTGINIEINTFNVTKTFLFYVDQVLVSTQAITTNGRKLVHVTLGPARGHLYRFVSADTVVAQLYAHEWLTNQEPSEQTNWNQNYSVAGTMADKMLKGVVLETDTFNAVKTVTVEVDGAVVETLAVTQNGRGVSQFSFAPHRGRVFRLLPTDANAGRFYQLSWIFDEEPLGLTRWETQEIDHGLTRWQTLVSADICLRSSSEVRLTVTGYSQIGVATSHTYTLGSTFGTKQTRFVPFDAVKGFLWKYLFVSDESFWLYREESRVMVQPWGGESLLAVRPFGTDDRDATRRTTGT